MNHTEFYQEYRRRRDKAMELAVLRYPSLDKRFLSVSFHIDSVFVGVYDRNDKFVENIIISGKDLDAYSHPSVLTTTATSPQSDFAQPTPTSTCANCTISLRIEKITNSILDIELKK